MKNSFKRLSIVLAVVMLFTSQFAFVFAADTDVKDIQVGDIVVLYTNDAHCAIDAYAAVAAHEKAVAAVTKNVTLADVGDAIQGDAVGTLSTGEYLVDVMNEVGYDVATLGNHEFDYGMDRFLELKDKAKYKYVCSNFVDLREDAGKAVLDAYTIVSYGDVKVAYLGIATPESITKSTPTYFQNEKGEYIYGFCNDTTGEALYKNVQAAVDAAKGEGANFVVALAHLGIDSQSSPWTSKEVIAKTTGIDVMLDGHSHSEIAGETVKNKDGKDVILSSTGTKLANIGQLVIRGDKLTTSLIPVEGHEVDAETKTFIDGIKANYENLLKEVVAKTEVALTTKEADGETRAVRNQETNMGDLCADAYKNVLGADVAFVNGGGIRADLAVGDVTYGDIIAIHPYGNMACLVEATGQEILDALEFASRSVPEENGGFLQVAGLEYTIKSYMPSTAVADDLKNFKEITGDRRVCDVKVNGEAIDPAKTYTLASHNYMLKSGGDGINMFMDNNILQNEVMIDNQVLITYIKDKLNGAVGSEYEKAQGRITIMYTPFTDMLNHWAAKNVGYAYTNKMFNGTSDTTFSPSKNMTNEMFITVLGRMSGKVTPAADGEYYADPYIAWAKENKIVRDDFDAKADITREDMALYIYNYYNSIGKGPVGTWAIQLEYTDLEKVSEDCGSAVMYATLKGFFGGYPDGSFKPDNTATRAEVAKVLQLVNEDLTAPAAEETTK